MIRAARAASSVPDIPMRILTATDGKPPRLQQRARELGEQTAANFPRGGHIAVPESGHYIHKDQPGTVLAAIGAVTDAVADRGTET